MDNIQDLIAEYTQGLTEQERLVMDIATEHLGSSFDIERSIGFVKWLASRTQAQNDKKQ